VLGWKWKQLSSRVMLDIIHTHANAQQQRIFKFMPKCKLPGCHLLCKVIRGKKQNIETLFINKWAKVKKYHAKMLFFFIERKAFRFIANNHSQIILHLLYYF
jgi:hypothetical protein